MEINQTVAFKLVFVVFTLIISWVGFFDDIALNYTNDSLKDAAVIYGSARLINATISVLQSAEVSAVVASISIGEILDPLNDLIERFSGVMLWGLSSLALQKILITIFSSYPVKLLLTILSFGMIVNLLLKKTDLNKQNHSNGTKVDGLLDKYSNKLELMRLNFWKYFLLIIAFKFSLAFIALMTAGISIMFTEDKMAKHNETMSVFSDTVSINVDNFAIDEEALQVSIDTEKENKKQLLNLKEEEESKLENIKIKLKELDNRSLFKKLLRREKSSSALQVEAQLLTSKRQIKNLSQKIEISEEKLSCAEKKLNDKECSNLITAIKARISTDYISQLQNDFKNIISSVINLLVLIILKTIILPILFLTILVYFTKRLLKV